MAMAADYGMDGSGFVPWSPPPPSQQPRGILGQAAQSMGLLPDQSQAGMIAQPQYQNAPGVNPFFGAVDNLLLNGAVQKAQTANVTAHNANIQRQYNLNVMQNYASQLPPSERALFISDPEGYLKAQQTRESTPLKGGESFTGGPGGTVTANLIGLDDKSGRGYSIGGNGAMTGSAQSLGGDYINGPGNSLVSGRTGQLRGTVTPPQNYPATNSYDPVHVTGFDDSISPGGPSLNPPMLPIPNVSGASAPRGIRNNNVTNLTPLAGGQKWAGQTGVDKGGYVQFDTPQSGMAAATQNLNAYATKHGINTVAALVGRWAPSGAGNNTGAYTQFVAKRLGVSPTAQIDLTDPATAHKALGAIAEFENGPKAFASGQGSPPLKTAAPAGPPPPPTLFPPGHIEGKTTQPLSKEEVQKLGLGPGRYERQADGSAKLVAAPPAADVDYVKGAKEEASNADDYARLADQYDTLSRDPTAGRTGPLYKAPFAKEIGSLFDPTLQTRQNLATQMATALRAPGMRLTQMEFQKFGEVSPNVENWGTSNTDIVKNARTLKALKTDRATFFEDYLYDHNTLQGAADQWQKIEDKKYGTAPPNASAPPPAQIPTLTFEQAQKAPAGTRFRDPSGTMRVKH